MMRIHLFRLARNDRGATAVEFAIVLPLLLLIIFGILEWSLYMYNRHVITNAAREGARFGTLMRKTPRDIANENIEICDRVTDFAGTRLVTFGSEELTCDPESTDNIDRDPLSPTDFGSLLTVRVDYDYEFLFLSTVGIGPLRIETQSQMRME